MSVLFVGQGPNRTCWEKGLERGRQLWPGREEGFAIKRAERLALTGSVGVTLAELLGLHRLAFLSRFGRQNLNSRWNGKAGKGDAFDRVEGATRAGEIIIERAEDRVVVLGQEVARCFGIKADFLDEVLIAGKRFLVFPHPSGVNQWWNDPANKRRAVRALRRFVRG